MERRASAALSRPSIQKPLPNDNLPKYVIAAAVLTLLIAAGLALYFFYRSHAVPVPDQARQYIIDVLPKLLTSWDETRLMEHASPSLKRRFAPDRMSELFNYFRPIGPLKKFAVKETRCEKRQISSVFHCQFVLEAEFGQGSGTIVIEVSNEGQKWSIENINIFSKFFKRSFK